MGESKGFGLKDKESWWWNENVQEKIKCKREYFKALQLGNNMENWEKYWSSRRGTKKTVSKVRFKVFEEF